MDNNMNSNTRFILKIAMAGSVFSAVLAGCTGSHQMNTDTKGSKSPAMTAPLTLSVYQTSANMSDEEFQRLLVEPVRKKYPNITLQLIRSSPEKSPQQLVTAGALPDIVFGSILSIQAFADLGVNSDVTDLLKKNGMDLSKFDTATTEAIQNRSVKGEVPALPFSVNFGLLFYNKDIFDKFAAAYPTDGMTWEEAIQLARKVTVSSDGLQYRGIDVDAGIARIGGQLSLPTVDPKTNKPTLATDGWKKVFDVRKMMTDIPGNSGEAAAKLAFVKDRTLAMLISPGARIGEIEEMFQQGNEIHWGLTQLPSFKEAPGKGFGPDIHLLMVPKTTKYREEAFAVISLLTGEEAQLEMQKGGRLSSLKDVKSKVAFGANLKSLKGVNVRPIVEYVTTADPPYSEYTELAKKQIDPAIKKATTGSTDINTALREAEELAAKDIAAEIQAKSAKKETK